MAEVYKYDVDGPRTGGRAQRQRWRFSRKIKRPGTAKERWQIHREGELKSLYEAYRRFYDN